MNAIILAAGRGQRLGKYGANLPKTLITINESTLIARILNGLHRHNIRDIKIITGFKSQLIKKSIQEFEIINQLDIEYFYNNSYREKGSFYSLYMGIMNITEGGAWIFDSDIIFDETLFEAIARHDLKSSVLCSSDLTLNEDKVIIVKDCEKVLDIGKKVSVQSSVDFVATEYIGVAYLSMDAINLMKLASQEMFNLEYEQVISKILNATPFQDLCLGNIKWNEIDTKFDLARVKEIWETN